jgi:hypothetical protein
MSDLANLAQDRFPSGVVDAKEHDYTLATSIRILRRTDAHSLVSIQSLVPDQKGGE